MFITVGIPILDSITSLIITYIEKIKGKITISITESNQIIRNISE